MAGPIANPPVGQGSGAPRGWILAVQLVAGAVVAGLVGRALLRNWSEFHSVHVEVVLRPGWIALSVLLVFATYALQVQSWRQILAGWSQRLSYPRALKIWLLVNLGRYVPGKVWSVAGLMVLAQRAGVDAWAAAASAVVIQALGVGTAVVVVAAAMPRAESPLRLAVAAVVAAGTIGLLAWARPARTLARLVGPAAQFRPLPLGAAVRGGVLTLLSWVTYGIAFWLLARGLGLPATLPFATAAGVFALGYILGLLALFAPGGVGVRELVFIGLLTPSLGSGGAVALSLGSRVLLTLTEAAGPLGMLLLTGGRKEDAGGSPQP